MCWERGNCEEVEIPSLRDDDVVERFVGFAKAGEADSEDHCLSTLLLERKSLDVNGRDFGRAEAPSSITFYLGTSVL